MNNDMKLYYDYTISPLGQLFYKTVWHQLSGISNKKVLDFGSGFGFTANFLAQNNDVTAVEIDNTMIEQSDKTQSFNQIHGDISALKQFEDGCFDVVICHLVLEFVEQASEILERLSRVLKKGGMLSVVKHNKNGRIIQSIVQDYDLEETKSLLDGGFSFSSAFGDIKYYENQDIVRMLSNSFEISDVFGVRVVGSLHSPKIQANEDWVLKMFEIESRLMTRPEFINIAYFNHVLLSKN